MHTQIYNYFQLSINLHFLHLYNTWILMGAKYSSHKTHNSQNPLEKMFKPVDNQLFLDKMGLVDEDLRQLSITDLSKTYKISLSYFKDYLAQNLITGRSEQFLLFSQNNLSQLLIMHLSHNQLQDAGLETLTKANCYQLQILDLRNNNLTSRGIACLRKAKWKTLKQLNLSENCIGDYGFCQLTKCIFDKLTILNLFKNCLTNKSILYLKNATFQHLQKLNFAQNLFTSEGIIAALLIKWKCLKQLRLRGFVLAIKQKQYLTRIADLRLGSDIFHDF